MAEIKPKPCPFCGSLDVDSCPGGEREDGKPWFAYYIHCNNCKTSGPLIQWPRRLSRGGAQGIN